MPQAEEDAKMEAKAARLLDPGALQRMKFKSVAALEKKTNAKRMEVQVSPHKCFTSLTL